MTEIDAEVKKWGNSLGIRVPWSLARAEGLQPGDAVRVKIEKVVAPNPAFFGRGRRLGYTAPTHREFYREKEKEKRREAETWARKMRQMEQADRREPRRRA